MPLRLIIAIPQGTPGTIEIRSPAPASEILPIDYACMDITDFLTTSAHDLAIRYGEPAFSALQGRLRERGY